MLNSQRHHRQNVLRTRLAEDITAMRIDRIGTQKYLCRYLAARQTLTDQRQYLSFFLTECSYFFQLCHCIVFLYHKPTLANYFWLTIIAVMAGSLKCIVF